MCLDEHKLFLPADRELTGAEKTVAEETDIDAEELPIPDSTVDEFNRGVTDLDEAKKEDEVPTDKNVSTYITLCFLSMMIIEQLVTYPWTPTSRSTHRHIDLSYY